MKLQNKNIKKFLNINFGVMGLAFAFAFFLSPNDLVMGGTGGIAIDITMLIERLLDKDLSIYTIDAIKSGIILGVNLILLLLSFLFVGKKFTLNTIFCSVAYPIYSYIFSTIYNLCHVAAFFPVEEANAGQMLIVILFSSIIVGSSVGLTIKNGASTGGIDILEQINFIHFKIPYSLTLLVCDGIIVLGACILKQDIYTLFYGVIFIFISGKFIDSVVFGGFKKFSVNIITTKPQIIRDEIYKKVNRGVTLVDAVGGYSGNNSTLIISIMASSEVDQVRSLVNEIDPQAFMYVTSAKEVSGVGFTKDK